MATKQKTQTDFTLREPNLYKQYNDWLKKRLAEELETNYTSPAFLKRIHQKTKWVKVSLKTDIASRNKIVAPKGDIVWAYFIPERPNLRLMIPASFSPAQRNKYAKDARSAQWHIRIPSSRKLSSRPMWEGELYSTNYRVRENEVAIVGAIGKKK